MIYIIGTWHPLQVWTIAKRNGEGEARKKDVEAFEKYLADIARSSKADMIGEELSEEYVAEAGHGASSVSKDVATQLDIQHLFCNHNKEQSRALNLKFGRGVH